MYRVSMSEAPAHAEPTAVRSQSLGEEYSQSGQVSGCEVQLRAAGPLP
jgi:hypothetical protein